MTADPHTADCLRPAGRHHPMERCQDMAHARRSWLVQRAGWALLAGCVGAAAAGWMGPGPLGVVTARSGCVSVSFQRWDHAESPTVLRVEAEGECSGRESLSLWINSGYLDAVEVESILPPPSAVIAAGERTVFEFHRSGSAPVRALFRLRSHQAGPVGGAIGVEDGDAVKFSQFFFP